jgi:hypothetical protein
MPDVRSSRSETMRNLPEPSRSHVEMETLRGAVTFDPEVHRNLETILVVRDEGTNTLISLATLYTLAF